MKKIDQKEDVEVAVEVDLCLEKDMKVKKIRLNGGQEIKADLRPEKNRIRNISTIGEKEVDNFMQLINLSTKDESGVRLSGRSI